ncbi:MULTISPECIES: Fic/DOC family protein [Pseudonocardia]|uniref:protein adenylyltransferase n=2 Tax=Pseudonocardia TaxID=1847 RepID=A0A1Y2MX03_PSEAH|nr:MULTISPECIES: Fic family protein [Pseudonocardia]OSY39726.1 Adenosine monophosphate-protein transferase VbhT [Pseudonocardia autotrophica]TDN72856.1 cell filamentation protein [Pseudonocardia autotrophica]BBG03574.1 cell division protein Fic [Pseudonocardia autotrophica]GEC28537.1 cell division protein Fic [Pseudonocardia saturnea]
MTDPYLDLDAGVLRNRLGITDAGELARAEAELTALRLIELRQEPLPGRYDLDHLQDFHHHIFCDIYDWAGELRTVSLGKGQLFCLPQHLESSGEDIFDRLHRTQLLRGRHLGSFVTGLAELLGDINALHPFREGNGRTQRAFMAQLARAAGYELRWTAMDADENNHASRLSLAGDNSALHAMIARLVQPVPDPPPQRPASDDS